MRKIRMLAGLLGVLVCLSSAALALELPGIAVFSPGLKRLAALETTQPAVHAQAQVSIEKAMYARDLSVLQSMLEGTTISYQRSSGDEWIALERGGRLLGAYALRENDALDALEAKLTGVAVLERVPLAAIADGLEGLAAGDTLPLGFAVCEPFSIERTMSDDGTRLTKIKISGSVARSGETPWRISGYLRQPAGRAPKDTFEIMLKQDEDNFIELLYSALRENEVTRKNKEGTTSVRTTLKAAGKIASSSISSRLSVTMKNHWRAEGDALSERISVTASLGHTDKTPGRRMQRLNDVAAEMKNVIRLTTTEAANEPIELNDEITFDVTMDGNAFLRGGADVLLRAGGEAQAATQELQAMDEAKLLAMEVYRTLDEHTKNTLEEGL